MGRRTMKPEGMRLEIKMDENEGRIKKVRVVFLKGDDELTVKMSME